MRARSLPVKIRSADYRVSANAEFVAALEGAGLGNAQGLDAALRAGRVVAGGRGPQQLVALPRSPAALRLRQAQRGGLFGGFLASRFLSPRRGEREIETWLALRERGAPIPMPVVAISRRRGLLWESHFGSLDRAECLDGLAWLAFKPSRETLARGAAALGRALRRFHDAGAVHGDLNVRNVLFEHDTPGPRCLFVDLDHTRIPNRITPRARMNDLMRLVRSIEKQGFSRLLDTRLRARALAAYCAGDRPLRQALLESLPGENRRLLRHRIAWRFGRVFSRGSLAGLAVFAGLALVLAWSSRESEARAGAAAPQPAWSILALGDTGRAGQRLDLFEGQLAVADALTREARRRAVDGLVFLGDNFYDSGLSEDRLVERVRTNLVRPYCYFLALTGSRSAEVASACPLDANERRPVPLFAVLGNHDLGRPESAGLQRTAIPEFLPGWQMSDGLTRVVEVRPGVSLILFESEIAIDDRAAIQRALSEAIRAARGPWRILATHRPIATDDYGKLPKGGYPDWVRDAIAQAALPVQLVLCGHHHNLQAFALGDPTPLLQIGAGSGSRAEPPLATGHPDLRYSALALGFARVDLIGESPDERLEVSLFTVPRWPWLGQLVGHRSGARFAVDRRGRIESLSPVEPIEPAGAERRPDA